MISIIKKILKLLTKSEHKRLYIVFVAMTISGLIEVLGVVSILPFLSLITNPDLIDDNPIFNWLYITLNFQSVNNFLIFIGAIVLFVLILSNVLVFLTRWSLSRFSWRRNYTISRRLLNNYLHKPYTFFINQNSSILGKNILAEVHTAVGGVIVPLLEIFSRGIVALFIFVTLITIDPLLALSLIIALGGAYIFIYKMVKQKIYDIGKRRYQTNAERYKAIDEAFGDIKLIKIMGREKFFLDSYSKPSAEYSNHVATNQIIEYIPRYVMEIIAFGGIIIVIIYLLATGKGFQEFLPLIGLYVFATYRLMPSLQLIFTGVTNIRFNIHALNTLYEDMSSLEDESNVSSTDIMKIRPLPLKKELKLENITFSYPGVNKPVLDNITLKIKFNTSIAFVGTTGAGKTTIANIILGLLRPDIGKILVDDVEITDKNLPSWQKIIGYIPQDIYLLDDTVTRNIAYGTPDNEINMGAVERSAKIANIHDFIVNEMPKKYQTVIGERGVRLSGGQKQRIGIARALYHNPGVLVLDEATSALDGATEKEVFQAIENIAKTKTLIIIAHRLTTIESCDVIYVIENGKIAGIGNYEELINSNEIFRKIAKSHLKDIKR